MAGSRRQVLGLLAIGIVLSGGVSGLLRRHMQGLDMVPLARLDGFYVLKTGPAGGGLANPLLGLDPSMAPDPAPDLSELFQAEAAGGQVPVASFSDYNCPYCRVLSKQLVEESGRGGISVTWHELPLLGPTSLIGARAALAAGRQGAYLPMHTRLMQSRFRINPAYVAQVADDLGLDGPRLLRDMRGSVVADALSTSAGLADLFGIFGTPALVVGRVLVLGQIGIGDFRRLVDQERGAAGL